MVSSRTILAVFDGTSLVPEEHLDLAVGQRVAITLVADDETFDRLGAALATSSVLSRYWDRLEEDEACRDL